jgi:hypothetical protein
MLLLALAPALASGQTIMNLASLPVLFNCLAQEPDLREEFTAELRKRNPEGEAVAKWGTMLEASSWAACVRQKKWVSKAYCTDLLEANVSGSRRDVARVMEKHWVEYQSLKPMVDYFQAHFPKDDAGAKARVSCPE